MPRTHLQIFLTPAKSTSGITPHSIFPQSKPVHTTLILFGTWWFVIFLMLYFALVIYTKLKKKKEKRNTIHGERQLSLTYLSVLESLFSPFPSLKATTANNFSSFLGWSNLYKCVCASLLSFCHAEAYQIHHLTPCLFHLAINLNCINIYINLPDSCMGVPLYQLWVDVHSSFCMLTLIRNHFFFSQESLILLSHLV